MIMPPSRRFFEPHCRHVFFFAAIALPAAADDADYA